MCQPTTLMEQDQLLTAKPPGESHLRGGKSLRTPPSQGPAALGFSLVSHMTHCGFLDTPCPHSSPAERVPSRLPPQGVEPLVFLKLFFQDPQGSWESDWGQEGLSGSQY